MCYALIICKILCQTLYLYIYLFIHSFIYLVLAVLGIRCCTWAFSSCGEWGLLFLAVRGLLIAVTSLVVEHGLQVRGLQQLQHTGSVVVARRLSSCGSWAQQLWCTGLVAPRHVGSPWSMDQTRVPSTGRRILNHCTSREVPVKCFKWTMLFNLHNTIRCVLLSSPFYRESH